MSRKSSFQLRKKLGSYYTGKTVAVAGGAGFVGVQLVRLLSGLVGSGGRVIVLDDYSRGGNVVEANNVEYGFITGPGYYYPYELVGSDLAGPSIRIGGHGVDVSDWKRYSFLLDGVDAFFNLAAVVAGVLHNQNHHLQMYDDNIRVLAGPLRACEQAGVPAFFQTSSVCVYSEDHQSPCLESAGWGGDPNPANAGYAEAKRDGERAAIWSNIDRVVIGRPSNIIGPYDYFDEMAHVVPAFVKRAIETDGDFVVYGTGMETREFIHSWDVATGMASALAFGKDRQAYNIGTDSSNQISMLDLARKINEFVHIVYPGKSGERKMVPNSTAGGGDMRRYSNAGKLRSLGWEHVVDLDSAIQSVVLEYINRIVGLGYNDPYNWYAYYGEAENV
jgi:nucleoside-diphosphate-sugar epimerase